MVCDRSIRLLGARGPPGTVGLLAREGVGGLFVSLAVCDGTDKEGAVGCLSLLLRLAFLPNEAKKFPVFEGVADPSKRIDVGGPIVTLV